MKRAAHAIEKIHPTFRFTRDLYWEDVMALLMLKSEIPFHYQRPADPLVEHVQT
ncbi:hypothetical protein SAMN05216299_11733 [Nitrosospira sp. Nsp14]|nr:hypothetical protein SAMN05216299_11733 [Nitrosospira sp. Nsp14]